MVCVPCVSSLTQTSEPGVPTPSVAGGSEQPAVGGGGMEETELEQIKGSVVGSYALQFSP